MLQKSIIIQPGSRQIDKQSGTEFLKKAATKYWELAAYLPLLYYDSSIILQYIATLNNKIIGI